MSVCVSEMNIGLGLKLVGVTRSSMKIDNKVSVFSFHYS